MTDREYELHKLLVKFVCFSQVIVEIIDDLKDTHIYRQDIKFQLNNISTKLENILNNSHQYVNDKEDEKTYMNVERGVRILLNETIESLYDKGDLEKDV